MFSNHFTQLPIDTVNLEIPARILFSRIVLKDMFATLEIRELGMIYENQ